MSELDILLNELRNMQEPNKQVPNTPETWQAISQGDWVKAGFSSEDEMKSWISDNPYQNM